MSCLGEGPVEESLWVRLSRQWLARTARDSAAAGRG